MKDSRRPLLVGGVLLLAAGALAYFFTPRPGLGPWLLLAGVLCLLMYFVLRRLAAAPQQREAESMLYEEGNTTMLDDPDKRQGG